MADLFIFFNFLFILFYFIYLFIYLFFLLFCNKLVTFSWTFVPWTLAIYREINQKNKHHISLLHVG